MTCSSFCVQLCFVRARLGDVCGLLRASRQLGRWLLVDVILQVSFPCSALRLVSLGWEGGGVVPLGRVRRHVSARSPDVKGSSAGSRSSFGGRQDVRTSEEYTTMGRGDSEQT